MKIVILTALGVGGASVIGAVFGLIFKKISHKFNDIVLSFAAGIMLSAAVIGLILPSLEYGGKNGIIFTVIGVFAGAICIDLMDKLVPHLHKLSGADSERHPEMQQKLNKVLLFVIAIAIHNLPEGLAAGVGFGTGNNSDALTIAAGIALQNIPEGMVIIAPMLSVGLSSKRAFLTATITGVIEVFGTLIGYFAVSISEILLPFMLAFAGGTMLYVISDEMIPETHSHGNEKEATFSLITGFCIMLVFDILLG